MKGGKMSSEDLRDNFIRTFFKKETARTNLSIFGGIITIIIILCILLANREEIQKSDSEILPNALQQASIMAALLSGLAYNLRVRSIDYYVKSLNYGKPTHNPQQTARTLTNLTVLSFVSAMLLLSAACFPPSSFCIFAVLVAISSGLVLVCILQYIYTIFAQEKLEEAYLIKEQQAYIEKVRQGETHPNAKK